MLYAIVNTSKAADRGISSVNHRKDKSGQRMIVNEKELLSMPGADLNEKAALIEGEVISLNKLKEIIAKKDWI